MTNEPSHVLEVRGLTITHRGRVRSRTLVRDVGFSLRAGETLGIIGESGSGKSITSRAIVGLLPPEVEASGSVRLGEQELVGASDASMRRVRGRDVVLLMQDPFTMLNPLLTAGQHIAEGLRREGSRRSAKAAVEERVRAALHEVGIRDAGVADRHPWQLSGGMRQRVALAAALTRDPAVLIADEPTTALDASTQLEILELLAALRRRRGLSVIFVTHDLRVARSISDRLLVMYAGALLEDQPAGSPRAPAHPYTLGMTLAAPPVDRVREMLVAIPGSVPRADEVLECCAFASRCRWAADVCRAAAPPLREIAPGHRSACVRLDAIEDEMREVQASLESGGTAPAPADRADRSLVAVTDLRMTYRRKRQKHEALKGVSLTIAEGESVAVVGESGSGKTTLARCLLGLNVADSGEILIAGHSASDYRRLSKSARAEVRATVQAVFQDPYSSLNPSFRIRTILREPLTATGRSAAAEDVHALLQRVGLPVEYAARRPAALSGGERQRVAIARALATQPRLLICDEPVSALDVSVQAQILELLRDVQRSAGTALLFITHDLAVARQIAQRVVVLLEGEIVEDGPADSVFANPEHPYTRRLLDAAALNKGSARNGDAVAAGADS
jgi:peptide/nickel transport system ATP-binding protein